MTGPEIPRPREWRKSLLVEMAAFLWGAAEGALFFLVPDILMSFIALKRGLRAGLVACVAAAVGAGLGGLAIYAWSARDLQSAEATIAMVPGVSEEMIDGAWQDMMDQGWFLASMEGPLTRTPYKVYALLAPHVGADRLAWAAAALPIRLPRFLLVTVAVALLAQILRGRVADRHLTIGLGTAWALFYAWLFLA